MDSLDDNGDEGSLGDSLLDGQKDSPRRSSAQRKSLDSPLDEIESFNVVNLIKLHHQLDLLDKFTVNLALCSSGIPSNSVHFEFLVSDSNLILSYFLNPSSNLSLISGIGFEVKLRGFGFGWAP